MVASAAMVATVVAITAAKLAITSERVAASRAWSLAQADWYQRQDKPSHIAIEAPALKE